jgi:hypothetical protein
MADDGHIRLNSKSPEFWIKRRYFGRKTPFFPPPSAAYDDLEEGGLRDRKGCSVFCFPKLASLLRPPYITRQGDWTLIVLIAGMPRSGSTFSFNVVRMALQARGTVYQATGDDILGAVHQSNGAEHVLVKTHSLDESSMELAKTGAVQIIITVRRIEDALASWVETFETLPDSSVIEIMGRWVRMFHELRNLALIVSYRQIDHLPWLAAWRITRTICPKIGPMEVTRIAQSLNKATIKRQADSMELGSGILDTGWSYYDTRTFFHRRHISHIISRTAEERLPPDRLRRIRDAMKENLLAVEGDLAESTAEMMLAGYFRVINGVVARLRRPQRPRRGSISVRASGSGLHEQTRA